MDSAENPSPQRPTTPVLELRSISKSFGGEHAVKDVDLSLHAGEIRGLVGANGSGKSTLVKILAGLYQPDDGEILVDGEQVDPARDRGIQGFRFIHQDLALIDDLTVAENLALDRARPNLFKPLRLRREARAIRALLKSYDLNFSPYTEVGSLSAVERTMLAVARAFQRTDSEQTVLVLDEVTATLPPHETGILFEQISRLKNATTIFVSHRIEEVLEHCDAVTALRDGQVVGDVSTATLTPEALVHLIIGREPGELFPTLHSPGRTPILATAGLSGKGIEDLTMEVHSGEIVGLASLNPHDGSKILRLLYGEYRRSGGSVSVGGVDAPANLKPAVAAEMGISLVSDRLESGIPGFSLRENLTLNSVREFTKRGILRNREERRYAARLVGEYDIRPPRPEMPFSALSGGNQQKAIFAKSMRTNPKLLLLDDPTRGVDVGAKAVLYDAVRAAADDGLSVLISSSELEELCGLCHRVIVLRDGRPNGEIEAEHLDPDHLLQLCYLRGGSTTEVAGQ
jgi:ribose transport system ATP-binding protein